MAFQKIYRFASIYQRKFLTLYFQRYELVVLKNCMRSILIIGFLTLILLFFQKFFDQHSKINISALASCETMEEFIASLKDSVYYGCLLKVSEQSSPTLWDYEMALDLFYFTSFWKQKDKILKGAPLKIFTEAYGTKMDLLNIDWIYRSKHFFQMSASEIYAILIPIHYHLKKEDIKRMVEGAGKQRFPGSSLQNILCGPLSRIWRPVHRTDVQHNPS